MDGVIDLEDLDGDAFEFEPTPDDLALAIGLLPDPESDRVSLEELGDAMLVWAEGPLVDRLASAAVEAIWHVELEGAVADGLRRVASRGDEWAPAAERALAEVEREPKPSPIARAVVERLAMELAYRDVPPFFCLCCIDEMVRASPSNDRRALAVQCAPAAWREADIDEAELTQALSASGLRSAIERLCTTTRRRAVRSRFGRLGVLGRESVPALARELRSIAAESLPADPRDDDVWLAVATVLLADRARPELN